jgi:hypothetical protein
LAIKVALSIELLVTLWLKEETLPIEMELEENQFMDKSLLTKTLNLHTINHIYYQWQMLEKILMDHNSLSLLLNAIGLTESTSYLDKL